MMEMANRRLREQATFLLDRNRNTGVGLRKESGL